MPSKPSKVVTFTVPQDIKDILEIITSIGYYDSLSEFLRDAIRSHLRANKGLTTLIAFNLYKAKKISIGKAGLLTNNSLEKTKEMFKLLET